MKCPKCEHNQKFVEGMTCTRCRYRFVLSPKEPPKISDARMVSYIRKASGVGTRYFTMNQLYMIHCRRMVGSAHLWVKVYAFLFLAGIAVTVFVPGFLIFSIVVFFLPFLINLYRISVKHDFGQFWIAVREYERAYPIPKLIHEPGLENEPPPADHPDVYDYGVEAVLIVERRILVDLLVRNGWHLENKTLVISEDGYPSYLQDHARKLLEENRKLPVYLMHDATEYGEDMAARLAGSRKLPIDGHPITDMGLFTEDVKRIKKLNRPLSRSHQGRVPIDMMAYPMLAVGLGASLAGGLAFAEILDQQQRQIEGNLAMGFG
ncbi:MAG: hypothetical protein QNK37_26450 [Acidobacteriota bacterium]|nr:hypothetical protein [Acidobacteriota bacterium]